MKRVVGALNPAARRLRGVVLRRRLHHRRRVAPPTSTRWRRSARLRATRTSADEPLASGAAERRRRWADGRPQDSARRSARRACGLDTLAVREGLPASAWGENSEALFLTSSFVQPDAATAAARFANEEEAFIYSRFTNPTVTMLERRLAALEGAEACIATSSGMSAILLLGMGLLKAGDHVICSQSVFGSTIMLFGREFAKFGVETTFVSQTDVGAVARRDQAEHEAAVRRIADQPAHRGVRHPRAGRRSPGSAGAWLAVDNCFCTPALQRPIEYGADLVIHSGTKYLDGQGRVIAGAICGREKLVNETFVPVMRSAGMALSPFNAWVVLKGLETLSIRMQAQSAAGAGAGALARGAAAGRARLLSRARVASAARARDGAAVGQRRRGRLVHRRRRGRRRPRLARRNAFHVIDSTAGLLDHRQPRRHQDHDHASGQHLARAAHAKSSAWRPASPRG